MEFYQQFLSIESFDRYWRQIMGWAATTKHQGEPKPPSEEMALALDTQQLRYLARQIEDEAHLQRILETITDGVMRLEVEMLLRPMLLFKAPRVGEPEA